MATHTYRPVLHLTLVRPSTWPVNRCRSLKTPVTVSVAADRGPVTLDLSCRQDESRGGIVTGSPGLRVWSVFLGHDLCPVSFPTHRRDLPGGGNPMGHRQAVEEP